jgi:hypothetical protein
VCDDDHEIVLLWRIDEMVGFLKMDACLAIRDRCTPPVQLTKEKPTFSSHLSARNLNGAQVIAAGLSNGFPAGIPLNECP